MKEKISASGGPSRQEGDVIYKVAATIIALYGVLSMVGGIIGFVKAHSTASLATGVPFGAILVLSAIGIFYAPRPALVAAIIVALLIGGFFGSKLVTNASNLRGFIVSSAGPRTLAMTTGALIVIVVSAIALAGGSGSQAAGTGGEPANRSRP
jgi:uncharacterized membrane protein (UPF0136 family)